MASCFRPGLATRGYSTASSMKRVCSSANGHCSEFASATRWSHGRWSRGRTSYRSAIAGVTILFATRAPATSPSPPRTTATPSTQTGLDAAAYVSHINVNDQTVEGIALRSEPVLTIQYHSEACPGPLDNGGIFDRFIEFIDAGCCTTGPEGIA